MLLLVIGGTPALADSLFFDFENFDARTIEGQHGWSGGDNGAGGRILINPAIDQEIVVNSGAPASFGTKSWRISNAFTEGSFQDMPFAPSLANEAGESKALNSNGPLVYSGGIRQNHYDMQWDFTSKDPTNPSETDSYVSISADRGDGARMTYIRLEDHPAGMQVFFDDYQDKAPYGSLANPAAGCGPEDNFVETMVASGLDRTAAHTVRLSVDFFDGPRNDVVRVFVDGSLVHTGTTWEDYFRWCTESGGGIPFDSMHDQSRTVDQIIFRVGGADGETHPQNRGKGFLIDNVAYSSSTVERECDNHQGNGDHDTDNGSGGHGHAKFSKKGCSEQSSDNAQFDDDQQNHHFQSTAIESGDFSTTATGGHMLTMTGIGTDNGNQVGFTMVAVDNGALAPATYSIVLTDGYSFIGTVVPGGTFSVT